MIKYLAIGTMVVMIGLLGVPKACAVETTVTWGAPTENTDGSPIQGPLTYKLFQDDGTTQWVVEPITNLMVTVTNDPNQSIVVWVTAVDVRGLESGPSNSLTNDLYAPNPPSLLDLSW